MRKVLKVYYFRCHTPTSDVTHQHQMSHTNIRTLQTSSLKIDVWKTIWYKTHTKRPRE